MRERKKEIIAAVYFDQHWVFHPSNASPNHFCHNFLQI